MKAQNDTDEELEATIIFNIKLKQLMFITHAVQCDASVELSLRVHVEIYPVLSQ